MQNNKVLAVWGNPNSGKTTTSVKLALSLSKMGKNVALVFCDPVSPTISTVMPFAEIESQSLGEILSAPTITQESILKNSIAVKKHKNICVLGYMHGEHERSYAKYSKERVIDLFILLKHLADFVIVDCSSYLSNDVLSRTSLELSDQVVRLITPDLKAISFFDSSLPLIAERKFNISNHYKVLSNVKENMPYNHVSSRFGGVSGTLVYVPEIEKQFYEGELFNSLDEKNSLEYEAEVLSIRSLLYEDTIKSKPKVKAKDKIKLPFKKKRKGDDADE